MVLKEQQKQNKLSFLLKKGIETGLIVFALGIPFSISLSQIGFISALLFWIIKIVLVRPEKIKGTFLDLFLGLYLLGLLISSVMSVDFFFSLKANKNVWLFSLLYLVLNNSDYTFTVRLTKIFLIASALSGIYGIFQSLTGFDLWHWGRLEIYGFHLYGAVGGLGLHLTYGAFQMMVAVILLSITLYGMKDQTQRQKFWISLSAFLVTVSVILSFARTAWVGLSAGFFSLGLLGFFLKSKRAVVIVLVVFVLMASLFSLSGDLKGRFLRIFTDLKHSQRTELWSGALAIIKDHPVFGIGSGMFDKYFIKYKPDYKGAYGHTHNDYLGAYLRSGLIGFIGYILLFFVFIIRIISFGIKVYPSNKLLGSFQLGVALAVVSLLVAGLGQNYFTASVNSMLLWFLFSLALSFYDRSPEVKSSKGEGRTLVQEENP